MRVYWYYCLGSVTQPVSIPVPQSCRADTSVYVRYSTNIRYIDTRVERLPQYMYYYWTCQSYKCIYCTTSSPACAGVTRNLSCLFNMIAALSPRHPALLESSFAALSLSPSLETVTYSRSLRSWTDICLDLRSLPPWLLYPSGSLQQVSSGWSSFSSLKRERGERRCMQPVCVYVFTCLIAWTCV